MLAHSRVQIGVVGGLKMVEESVTGYSVCGGWQESLLCAGSCTDEKEVLMQDFE